MWISLNVNLIPELNRMYNDTVGIPPPNLGCGAQYINTTEAKKYSYQFNKIFKKINPTQIKY